MSRKLIIYLADLANTKFGCSPSTVPLSIGYIKAYAVSKLQREVNIRLFRTFEDLYRAVQVIEPDIIGCSWYGWNYYLTTNALSYIKSRFPNIVTVVGGSNVPEKAEYCLEDFRKFPWIDVMVPNEGEVAFTNLIKVYLQYGRELFSKVVLDNVFYLDDSGELVNSGKMLPLAEDINIFPSPYLNGSLDEFLDSDLMPIIQTSRGCPFRCAFCVSAKDSWKKIRIFDLERVKAEIDFLEAKTKNRTLRFADENFGIIPRDIDIVKFIAAKRADSGYPVGLRLYTHKDINDRVKDITLLLKDLIPMNISFQTLTTRVLKNIGRQNIDLRKFNAAVSWAHNNDINVTSEMIFGLPGETYDSFIDVMSKLIKLRLDSVAAGPLMMLKETEVNRPQTIEKYGYKVMYSIAERGYTKFGQFENIEIDAWAVENKNFNFDEYIKMRLFILLYDLFMNHGYFKEMIYICDNRSIDIASIISEILNNPSRYPLFSRYTGMFKECLQSGLFKTEEEAGLFFSRYFSDNNNKYIGFMSPFILSMIIIGEMIHSSNQDAMINEVSKAAISAFIKRGLDNNKEFLEEIQFAKILAKNIIVPFWKMPEESIYITSCYDLIAWLKNDYRGVISKFKINKSVNYRFKIRSIEQYNSFIQENRDKPVYLQSELFFRTFRSNNVRRLIVSETNI